MENLECIVVLLFFIILLIGIIVSFVWGVYDAYMCISGKKEQKQREKEDKKIQIKIDEMLSYLRQFKNPILFLRYDKNNYESPILKIYDIDSIGDYSIQYRVSTPEGTNEIYHSDNFKKFYLNVYRYCKDV